MKKSASLAKVASTTNMSSVSGMTEDEEEEEEEVADAAPKSAIDTVAEGGDAAKHIKPIRFPDPGKGAAAA